MKQVITILAMFLLWSCTSHRTNNITAEPILEPKQIDLLEWLDINANDSLQLIQAWRVFINDFQAQKGVSSDTVECWSAEAFQNGNYSAADSMTIDSCITRLIMPLRKSNIWQLFKTQDYNVGIHRYQSEKEGRYFISFPRQKAIRDHERNHTFYFRRQAGVYRFYGYTLN